MRRRRYQGIAAGLAGLLLLIASPVAADITVISHYAFTNGDTLTRASYYTTRRIRTTLANGDEIIYDHSARRIALVDHATKRYWEGPRTQADSIAMRIRAERVKAVAPPATPELWAQWTDIYSALTDSVRFGATGNQRKIAGYPCSEWVLTAGPYLRQERWVARALAEPDFSPEVQKVVLASILDPLAGELMTLVLQAYAVDGLTLAGRMSFKTLAQEGEMSWEALKVVSGRIPPQAWAVPRDYERWEPPASATVK
jgi:hypothetical protein